MRTRGSCSRHRRDMRVANRLRHRPQYVHPLQYQLQIKPELQLADDDDRGRIATEGDKFAAADLALYLKSQVFEKTFDRTVEPNFTSANVATASD